jgi:AcrR family transcriptional regulator
MSHHPCGSVPSRTFVLQETFVLAGEERPIDDGEARTRLLDTAETLFYARGIHAVGMDELRTSSGLPLKRVYKLFPGKDQLVDAFLERRDAVWRADLAAFVVLRGNPEDRLLAVFDWLESWFGEPGFRGCAWINAHGELGARSAAVVARARDHKTALMAYLTGLVADADLPADLAQQLYLLVEGATVTAGITAETSPAATAKDAAVALIGLARERTPRVRSRRSPTHPG